MVKSHMHFYYMSILEGF